MSKSKSTRGKAYKPKYSQLPSGIPGIAIGHDQNPANAGFVTRTTGRYFAAMLAGSEDWTPHQMNELILGLNISQKVLAYYPKYSNPVVSSAVADLLELVKSIRARRERAGRYGVSGDELIKLRRVVRVLDTLLGSVPLARIAKCEDDVFKWHRKNGAHVYGKAVAA